MDEVRRLRQERGWTQTGLAFRAGLATSVISQIETGKRDPSASTLRKLANGLNVEVADLFPKVEAPLWPDQPHESGAFNFREARKELEKYCAHWEWRISEGIVTEDALMEFVMTGLGWIPVLDIALQAEEAMLRATEQGQAGANGNLLKKSEIWQADKRYLDLFGEVVKLLAPSRPELAADLTSVETNVVSLQEARERTADIRKLRKRMVG